MHRDRLAEGVEYNCLQCGNVEYGEGFTALSREDDAGTRPERRRYASHAGSRL
jgi:hypothetical protein